VDTSFLESLGVALGRWGTVKIDPSTGATTSRACSRAADVVTDPRTSIDAIAAGRRRRGSIGAYLRGEAPAPGEKRGKPQRLSEGTEQGSCRRIEHRSRIAMPEESVGDRVTDFREEWGWVTRPRRPWPRRAGASRARLRGCIGCGECLRRCEAKAIDYTKRDELVEKYFDGIVVAPGFDLYDPTEKAEFGYGRLKGVITGMEFEGSPR
jgi:ferredoxin